MRFLFRDPRRTSRGTLLTAVKMYGYSVLAAETLHFYFPRLVDLHNYPPANSATQKYNNWNTLNRKATMVCREGAQEDKLSDQQERY
jgi:hypothetical protein